MSIVDVDYLKKPKAMSTEIKGIYDLMKEDANGRIKKATIFHNRLFLEGGGRERNELMLRLGSTGDGNLIIARLAFINQRQGYGTRLLELLTNLARKEGYISLGIECVHTDEMESFARKNGFEQVISPFSFGSETNWIKKI
ncbi:hypothetical protein [Priestia megaterium]|uniref:hypothetical protein n=1 Tax=Priestia megaterium TaxID=1404 RepID=UPI003101AA1D